MDDDEPSGAGVGSDAVTLRRPQYPDIVRDVLTNLTQGVTRRAASASTTTRTRVRPGPRRRAERRPVDASPSSRVCVAGADARTIRRCPTPSRLNDYELVPDPNDPTDLYDDPLPSVRPEARAGHRSARQLLSAHDRRRRPSPISASAASCARCSRPFAKEHGDPLRAVEPGLRLRLRGDRDRLVARPRGGLARLPAFPCRTAGRAL